MKRKLFLLIGLSGFALLFAGCGDKVSDPEALYQKYLNDKSAREAKLKECRLMSTEDQVKSQSCTIAQKAAGDEVLKRRGGVNMPPVKFK